MNLIHNFKNIYNSIKNIYIVFPQFTSKIGTLLGKISGCFNSFSIDKYSNLLVSNFAKFIRTTKILNNNINYKLRLHKVALKIKVKLIIFEMFLFIENLILIIFVNVLIYLDFLKIFAYQIYDASVLRIKLFNNELKKYNKTIYILLFLIIIIYISNPTSTTSFNILNLINILSSTVLTIINVNYFVSSYLLDNNLLVLDKINEIHLSLSFLSFKYPSYIKNSPSNELLRVPDSLRLKEEVIQTLCPNITNYKSLTIIDALNENKNSNISSSTDLKTIKIYLDLVREWKELLNNSNKIKRINWPKERPNELHLLGLEKFLENPFSYTAEECAQWVAYLGHWNKIWLKELEFKKRIKQQEAKYKKVSSKKEETKECLTSLDIRDALSLPIWYSDYRVFNILEIINKLSENIKKIVSLIHEDLLTFFSKLKNYLENFNNKDKNISNLDVLLDCWEVLKGPNLTGRKSFQIQREKLETLESLSDLLDNKKQDRKDLTPEEVKEILNLPESLTNRDLRKIEDLKPENNTTIYKEIFLIIITFVIFNLLFGYFNYTPVENVEPLNNSLDSFNNSLNFNPSLTILETYKLLIEKCEELIILEKELAKQVRINSELFDLIDLM